MLPTESAVHMASDYKTSLQMYSLEMTSFNCEAPGIVQQ